MRIKEKIDNYFADITDEILDEHNKLLKIVIKKRKNAIRHLKKRVIDAKI